MTTGQLALAASAAVFLGCLAFSLYARRRPAAAPAIEPRALAPARDPVIVAAEWIAAERGRRAAERFVDALVDDGLEAEVDRLRGTFSPKK